MKIQLSHLLSRCLPQPQQFTLTIHFRQPILAVSLFIQPNTILEGETLKSTVQCRTKDIHIEPMRAVVCGGASEGPQKAPPMADERPSHGAALEPVEAAHA